MSKKYGLTKHEQALLTKALKYQEKAEAFHREFADSLENRFYNSQAISEFEEYDLWTLNLSGDSSFDEEQVQKFWNIVKQECKDDK